MANVEDDFAGEPNANEDSKQSDSEESEQKR